MWMKKTSLHYTLILENVYWKLNFTQFALSEVNISSSQSVLNTSSTSIHICFSVMVIVNFIWNYWIFLMSLLDVGSHGSGRLPRLQWCTGAVVWMWSNVIVFFFFLLSLCVLQRVASSRTWRRPSHSAATHVRISTVMPIVTVSW